MITRLFGSMILLPALLAAGTVGASADTTGNGSGMSLTVPSSAALIARVAIPVTVQISCRPPDLSVYSIFNSPFVNSSGAVTVSQPSGRSVNSATGFVSGQIICDNTSHAYAVSILATAPFRTGQAAITGSASWTESFFGCLNVPPFGCNFFTFQNAVSAQGPLSLTG